MTGGALRSVRTRCLAAGVPMNTVSTERYVACKLASLMRRPIDVYRCARFIGAAAASMAAARADGAAAEVGG